MKVAETGKLDHEILNSPRAKDGRGNISPVTIIFPTLAMRSKLKVAKNLPTEYVLTEMAKLRKEEINTDISEKDFDEMKKFVKTVPNIGNGTYSFNMQNLYNKALNNIINKETVIEEFFKLLEQKVEEARITLFERFDWQCRQSEKSAKFMYENNTMYGYIPKEGIRSAMKHGTIVIGQLGLAETLQILLGVDHTSKEGMELAIRIEKFMNQRCKEYKQKYKMNVGVYFTPAENLCYTSMKKFQKEFGEIDSVSDHDYFTNSIHVPVWKKITPFDKIDYESMLTNYSNAGCIFYGEFDASIKNNLEALEEFINYALDHDLPYVAANVPSDTCEDCGYQGLIDGDCPICGSSNIQRLRRVTGYLTGDYKTAFNKGKQQESEQREKHNGVEVK